MPAPIPRSEQALGAKTLDQWSLYDYKETFQRDRVKPIAYPGWVPQQEKRRINAYGLLESMFRNAAREWTSTTDEVKKRARREYGDPNLLVQVTLTSLLGDSQKIIVDGAIHPEDDDTDTTGAPEQQELLDTWSKLEKFPMKLWESERQSVKYGDSVYIIGWDDRRQRPRLNVYDPGFYYPEIDPMAQGAEDFPKRIHIAYEYEEQVGEDPDTWEVFVRRITWELVEYEYGRTVDFPWNDEPSFETCLYTDAIWRQADIDKELYKFDLGKVYKWMSGLDDEGNGGGPVDLELDFIPVVHVPNTIALQNHFGDSILGPVMQILDDVVATDTDLQAAAATTGSPPIAVSNASLAKTEGGTVATYGPGTVFEVGDGTATVIDTSMSLKALLEMKDALLERLSVNSRTPEALLGRVKPNEVPSGIALTLSFAPHSSQVREYRQVRDDKYSLLLKFVCRYYMKYGQLEKIHEANLKFGSFLPADKQEAMTVVTQLLASKAISLETAVTMLVDAGYPIEDYVQEIDRIQARDFAGANELALASGDANEARAYLGLDDLGQADLEDPFVDFQDPQAQADQELALAKAKGPPGNGAK